MVHRSTNECITNILTKLQENLYVSIENVCGPRSWHGMASELPLYKLRLTTVLYVWDMLYDWYMEQLHENDI